MDGGGPGGGGGKGIPGSHRLCDAERDLAEVGVSIALVETARLEFGGIMGSSMSAARGICIVRGCGLEIEAGGGVVDSVVVSLRLPREGMPKRRSREPPRPPAFGGGGKF